MRVIAGQAKGTRLGRVPPGTRPLSDRAREGLFASLGGAVVEARCLDLFAGTGAVGIEALSRGASSCVFVERSRAAVSAIRDNLRRARLEDRARVVAADVGSFLGSPGARTHREDAAPDIVFLDPPYETDARALGRLVEALDEGWLEGGRWTVIVTRGQKGLLPAVPLHWAARRQLRYGDSFLTLYREVGWA